MKFGYNSLIKIKDEVKTVSEWSKVSKINKDRIVYRLRANWEHEKAVFHPLIPPKESGLMVRNRHISPYWRYPR